MHSHIKSYCRWNDTVNSKYFKIDATWKRLRVLLERNDGTFGSRGPWFSTASGCLSNFLLHFGVAMKPWLNTLGAGTAQLWTRAIRERALYISASAVSWLWSFHDMCAVCMATASSTAIVFLKPDYHWQRPTEAPSDWVKFINFSPWRLMARKWSFPPFCLSRHFRWVDAWHASEVGFTPSSFGSKCMWTKIGAIF